MNEWVRPGDLSKFIVPRIDLCHVQYAILPWLLMWLHSGLPHVRIGLLHSIKMAWLYRSHHFLLLSIVSVGAILLWTLLRLRQLRDGKLEVRLCTSEILERQHCCMVRIVASGAGWPVFKDAISFVVPGMSYQERLETIHASVNCRYNSVAISFFFSESKVSARMCDSRHVWVCCAYHEWEFIFLCLLLVYFKAKESSISLLHRCIVSTGWWTALYIWQMWVKTGTFIETRVFTDDWADVFGSHWDGPLACFTRPKF